MAVRAPRNLFMLSFAAALLLPRAAGAQGAAGPGAQQTPSVPTIHEVVQVVATRVPEVPHEVPVSVEVIDGDTLRAMGSVTLRDALSLAAGVDVAPGGDAGPAGSVPAFWGLREFDAFLLVVDGVPYGGAFNPALTTLSLRDVDRIEVLRGPAPVTFGATSFVGVIHVVHKTGAAQGGAAAFRAGSFSSAGGAVELSPGSLGSWQTRINADFDRQGFRDERTSFGRGHASFRADKHADRSRSWLSADVTWLGQNPASPHPRVGRTLTTEVPVDANHNPANAFLDDTRFAGTYGTEKTMGGGATWSLAASYAHSAQSIFRGFLTDVSNTPDNATGYRENIDINDIYADTHVTWPERSHVRLVAGADYLFGNGEGRGATFVYTVPLDGSTATAVPEPTTLDLDTGARRSFFGAYALAEYAPTARLALSGGLRLNVTSERHGEGAMTTTTRPAGSAGVLFGIWSHGADHVRVFATYRNTFKPAAFDFSLAENEGVLDPETAQSIDGGIKARLAEGRVDVEASLFRMDFENLVIATVVDGLPSLMNSGKSRFKGVELASEVHARGGLLARASYSFHDARFVDFVQAFDGVPTQLGGKRIEMSPRHLFSAGLILAPDRGVAGSVVLRYVGDRFLNKRNTALADPYTTLDAGVGYRFPRWEIRLDGRNLTDRRDAVSESELGDAQYYLMTARRVDITCGLRF